MLNGANTSRMQAMVSFHTAAVRVNALSVPWPAAAHDVPARQTIEDWFTLEFVVARLTVQSPPAHLCM